MRRSAFPASTGSVSRLCPGPVCGRRISPSQIACGDCWGSLPRSLRNAYLAAKDGDCDAAGALEAAAEAIRVHLRKAAEL